jgi:hypothetical protein
MTKITEKQMIYDDLLLRLISPIMNAIVYHCSKNNNTQNHILNTHLIVEQVLTKIIKENFTLKKSLELKKINYQMKLDLMYSIKLIDKDCYQNFSELGEIRNKYTHELSYEHDFDDTKLSLQVKDKNAFQIKDIPINQLKEPAKTREEINFQKCKIYCTWIALDLFSLVDQLYELEKISFNEEDLTKELKIPKDILKKITRTNT